MSSSARSGNARSCKYVAMGTLGILFTLTAGELLAQANRRDSGRRAHGVRTTQSTPGQYQAPTFPRRLLPPAGASTSPANTAPGFYRQLDAPAHRPPTHNGVYGKPHHVPQVFYVPASVLPYTYAVGPTGTHRVQDIPVTGATQPAAPPPVYVVNQPPANPAPQVIVVHPAASAQQSPQAEAPTRAVAPPPAPEPTEPVSVQIVVTPSDASVFLDNDPLGMGADLSQDLKLKPGVHVLEVAHSEYRSQRVVFGVGSTDPLEVVVDLTTERVGRRSRIR